jgi:hypothetical protein
MPDALIVTEARLKTHFTRIAHVLDAAVDLDVVVNLEVDWDVLPVVGGISGKGCEFIFRNRGLRVPIAPFLHLRQGLWAWLGYREEWDSERPNRQLRRFSFRSSSLTVHFGWKNDLFKPQMFRAEWAGWAKWGGIDYCFQAANAAHPHWQFDALESLPDADAVERTAILRELLGTETTVREFNPQLAQEDVRDLVTAQKLSRIHFASAAAWWKAAPHNDHAHGPTSEADVESWVRSSLDYCDGPGCLDSFRGGIS